MRLIAKRIHLLGATGPRLATSWYGLPLPLSPNQTVIHPVVLASGLYHSIDFSIRTGTTQDKTVTGPSQEPLSIPLIRRVEESPGTLIMTM